MVAKLRSQPRIKGVTRLPGHSSLPPNVDQNLRRIARQEGRSLSWVKAEIICDWFGINAQTGKLKK